MLKVTPGLFLMIMVLGGSNGASADLVNADLGLTEVSISQKNQDLPANDLVYSGSPQFPTQQDAYLLKTKFNVDLSLLPPKAPSDIWIASSTAVDEALDQALDIKDGDETSFNGVLQASTGIFKFVVQSQKNSSESFTLEISRDLHMLFLRKEILRRLGYKIPAIKYLNLVKVQFANSDDRDNVLTKLVTNSTTGAASRWCYVHPDLLAQQKDYPCQPLPAGQTLANTNEVLFQDVLATTSTPLIYNVAMTVPINTATKTIDSPSRTLRALALVYALVNVPESVNQLTWSEGRIDSGFIKFVIPDVANFNCTLDDAKWIMNRVAGLSRQDITDIVAGAHYPASVSKLLVEKLIARRNSMLTLVGVNHTDLVFDAKVGGVDGLDQGRITQTNWPNYGSNFAFGEQASPLENIQYYFYSLVETNAFATLINEFNSKIPSLTSGAADAKQLAQLQQQGLRQYLETGQNQQVKFGTWHAPVASGGVTLSRSIVFGSYLGTSQLVQLADTFGLSVNVGLFIGTNGLPANEMLSGLVAGSESLTYTHLKPVTDLKTAFFQPIQQIFVPDVMRHIADDFHDLASLKTAISNQEDSINKDMKALKEYLSVGDSLIITQSLQGIQSVTATVGDFTTPLVPQVTTTVGLNELILWRLHIYRQDDATILVFKDRGEVIGPSISATFLVGYPASFPVLSVSASAVAGSAKTAISTVNISTDLKHNPTFFTAAQGLMQTVMMGSTEVLDSVQKPTILESQFTDKETAMRFFIWAGRTLNSTGHVEVTAPDGAQAHYLDLVSGSQAGHTYEAVANNVVSYILQRLNTTGVPISLTAQTAANPGQTLFGSSHTRQAELQARTDGSLSSASVQVQYKFQGWQISNQDAMNLVDELRQKYSVQFFDPNFLQDTRDIQFYQISATLLVYQNGLMQLLKTDSQTLSSLHQKYVEQLGCHENPDSVLYHSSESQGCYHMKRFLSDLRNNSSSLLDTDHLASLMMDTLSEGEQFLSFPDLVNLIGGPGNYYLTAQVSGFREGSETMSQSIPAIDSPGMQDAVYPQGILNYLEQRLGIDDGEFRTQWLRSEL